MREAAYWLYFECVEFTVHLANLSGTTYRDSNGFLFFVLWPAVTAGLLGWVCWSWSVSWRDLAVDEEG